MMTEGFASENIGQMHLDDRQIGGVQGIEDRDRGVGQRAGIQNDAVGRLARLMDPIDELTLMVGLAELDRQVESSGLRFDRMAIDVGLAGEQQVSLQMPAQLPFVAKMK